jgi:hypothetical protein
MPGARENLTKQVFVAYAYNLYDQRDYRKVYASLEKAFGVKFIFADEKITNMHILRNRSPPLAADGPPTPAAVPADERRSS